MSKPSMGLDKRISITLSDDYLKKLFEFEEDLMSRGIRTQRSVIIRGLIDFVNDKKILRREFLRMMERKLSKKYK